MRAISLRLVDLGQQLILQSLPSSCRFSFLGCDSVNGKWVYARSKTTHISGKIRKYEMQVVNWEMQAGSANAGQLSALLNARWLNWWWWWWWKDHSVVSFQCQAQVSSTSWGSWCYWETWFGRGRSITLRLPWRVNELGGFLFWSRFNKHHTIW